MGYPYEITVWKEINGEYQTVNVLQTNDFYEAIEKLVSLKEEYGLVSLHCRKKQGAYNE